MHDFQIKIDTPSYGTTHDVAVRKETIFHASELGVIHTETNGKV